MADAHAATVLWKLRRTQTSAAAADSKRLAAGTVVLQRRAQRNRAGGWLAEIPARLHCRAW